MVKDKNTFFYSNCYNFDSFSSTVYLGNHRKLQKPSCSGPTFQKLFCNSAYFLKFCYYGIKVYKLIRVNWFLLCNNNGNSNSAIFKL